MATPRKLNIACYTYPYGGNGGISSVHPDVMMWFLKTLPKASRDPRVGFVQMGCISDTPIPMVRNCSIVEARKIGADLLLCVDSDMSPDKYLGMETRAKPFFETAFDFIYERWEKGPNLVAAPYCGPPGIDAPGAQFSAGPHIPSPEAGEVVYAFHWADREGDHQNDMDLCLSKYPRATSAMMEGIQPAGAVATGLFLADMRLFELTEPHKVDIESILKGILSLDQGAFTRDQMFKMAEVLLNRKEKAELPWSYYEWSDAYQQRKASTDDVTLTRDIALIGERRLGYNPVHIAWDCWAGHWKPKCVGKPVMMTNKCVSEKLQRALAQGPSAYETIRFVDFTKDDPPDQGDESLAWIPQPTGSRFPTDDGLFPKLPSGNPHGTVLV